MLPVRAHNGLHEQIDSVTRKIRKSPGDAELRLLRADLYRLHRDWPAAEADLAKAATLDPKRAEVDLARTALLMDQDRVDAASSAVERFLSRRPSDAEG